MIGELKPYPAYKAFGVQWLREVPKHWETYRAKRLFRKMERSVKDSDEVVTCFRDGVVTLRKNRRVRGFTESLKEIGYQGVLRSDLVIHSMDAFAGAAGVSDSDGKATSVYSVCVPLIECVNPYYYAFCVREMARSEWILALTKGIRERSTDFRFTVFASQIVPLPPLTEQIAIVRYLDHADRRIRRYLLAKQKLIALLEEQKQAMIHEAVTGQIDVRTGRPYPTYKASGIEWLGDVPAHWEWRRLKTLLRRVDQRTVTGEETLLSLRRDHGVVIYAEHFHRPPQSSSFVGFKLVAVGQMVVNRLQANNGLVFCSGFDGVVSPDYSVFEMREALQMEYLSDLLRTSGYRSHFRRESTGLGTGTAGFLRLYDDKFLETEVFLPPAQEQVLILNSLANDMAKVRRLIEENRRQLQLMGEFRTRLIADVVTGKLDVREAAAGLPEVDPLVADDDLDDTIDADNRPEFDNDEEVVELGD